MRAQLQFARPDTESMSTALQALAWVTIVVHAVLMIAIAWRWAFRYDDYSTLGAVTLSALMLGFLSAVASVVKSLGHPAQSHAETHDEQSDGLALFPAEDSHANDLVLGSHLLATRRKALL
jgi:uncharacterized membrane protein YwzB